MDMGAYELDDSDADGMSDSWEMDHFGDLSAQAEDDPEADGLTNLEESLYGSLPTETDSDGDASTDGEEVETGWSPTTPTIFVYVNAANASGVEDGRSWATAFASIQAGVDAVHDAGEGGVWVAEGVYTGAGENVVRMAKRVYLYGGFSGAKSAQKSADPIAYPTIIDGEGVRRCVQGADEAGLTGFIVCNGKSSTGGSALHNHLASPTVTNCIFSQNTAGDYGVIANIEALTKMVNCLFTGNASGVAVIRNSSCNPSFVNCTLWGNPAGYGCAISNAWSSPTVQNCIVWFGDYEYPNEIRSDEGSSPLVTYSCVRGGYPGTGNIASDPRVDVSQYRVALQPDSPCINAGTSSGAPLRDILGVLRPQGAGYDMGAFEFVAR